MSSKQRKIYFLGSYKKKNSGRLRYARIYTDDVDEAVKKLPNFLQDDPRYKLYGISKMQEEKNNKGDY